MSYSCSDFYGDICLAAQQGLGAQVTDNGDDEIIDNTNAILDAILRAQTERRELLAAARAVIASWADGDLAAAVNDLEAAIAKAESANSRAG